MQLSAPASVEGLPSGTPARKPDGDGAAENAAEKGVLH